MRYMSSTLDQMKLTVIILMIAYIQRLVDFALSIWKNYRIIMKLINFSEIFKKIEIRYFTFINALKNLNFGLAIYLV